MIHYRLIIRFVIHRHLSIIDDSVKSQLSEKTAKAISTFVSTLPRLECLHDTSLYFSTTPTAFLDTLRYLMITIREGDYKAYPLLISEIHHLHITPFCTSAEEREDNLEAMVWDRKVRALIRNVKKMECLTLVMPGLPTCGCSQDPDCHTIVPSKVR